MAISDCPPPPGLADSLQRLDGADTLELMVAQRAGPSPIRSYRLEDLPRMEACARRGCQGGGLDLHVTARCVGAGEHNFNCLGYVNDGGLALPCDNYFRVVLKISHAPEEVPPP